MIEFMSAILFGLDFCFAIGLVILEKEHEQ